MLFGTTVKYLRSWIKSFIRSRSGDIHIGSPATHVCEKELKSGVRNEKNQRTGALPAMSSGCDPDKVHVVSMGRASSPLGFGVLR